MKTVLLILALLLPSPSWAIMKVMGGKVEQPNTPGSLTLMGIGGSAIYPRYWAPHPANPGVFYGKVLGTNQLLTRSTDFGATWATLGINSGHFDWYIAVAGSGDIVMMPTSANPCIIRRTPDEGASWSTAFTFPAPNAPCNSGALTTTRLRCVGSRCLAVDSIGRVAESLDSGTNWTIIADNSASLTTFNGSLFFDGDTQTGAIPPNSNGSVPSIRSIYAVGGSWSNLGSAGTNCSGATRRIFAPAQELVSICGNAPPIMKNEQGTTLLTPTIPGGCIDGTSQTQLIQGLNRFLYWVAICGATYDVLVSSNSGGLFVTLPGSRISDLLPTLTNAVAFFNYAIVGNSFYFNVETSGTTRYAFFRVGP